MNKRNKAYCSVNFAQAVIYAHFEDGMGEEIVELEEANEAEAE